MLGSPWTVCLTRARVGVLACVFGLNVLLGCGRIGVVLVPAPDRDANTPTNGDAGVGDGGPAADGGKPSGMDSGLPVDADAAQSPDAATSSDAGIAADGGCTVACENPHGSAVCSSDMCSISCSTGYADCDGQLGTGCESSTADSANNCGGCGLACANPHGTSSCQAGLCVPSCAASFGDCDRMAANGCETNLATISDCGSCGVSCSNAHGTTACSAGSCVPSCSSGYADCDGDLKNGCESNLNSDPSHCGSCTKACGTNGQICNNGACAASPCSSGRGECDGDLSVTCETDLTSSVNNCGFCGNVCTVAHGTPTCTSGSCAVASCSSGYADCDTNPSDGCEVSLGSDLAHCGSCTRACSNAHGTTACTSGACVPSCSVGYGDCDGNTQNGCELALNTPSNCGMCGKVCPANGGTATCNAGVCGTTCNLTGTYAIKLTVAVSWASRSYVSSGSGSVVSYSKLQGTHSGNSLTGTLIECGKSTPDFRSSILSETYDVDYPSALFTHSPLYQPSVSASVTLGSSSPGATFSLAAVGLLLGTTLSDPINGTWPSSASGLTSVDMDMNGKSGITASYRGTSPPTSASILGNRTDAPYVATRVVFSLGGTLTSCTQASGTASVTHVDTHIFGCHLTGGGDCNGSESSFLDNNQPVYTPSSASYTLVKVADNATCADVLAALP